MMKRTTVALVAATIALFGAAGAAQAEAPAKAQSGAKSPYWQCVTFARMFSGIQIFGDAWTWWNQATGKYAKGKNPEAGAVLVFQPTGRMTRGHVAVVSEVLSDRIIRLTHANWSPIGGSRGKVEQDVTAVDVSPGGDWSKVQVWYEPLKDMGTTAYPTYGFIYKAAKDAAQAAQASLSQDTVRR